MLEVECLLNGGSRAAVFLPLQLSFGILLVMRAQDACSTPPYIRVVFGLLMILASLGLVAFNGLPIRVRH
jgi:hypothetical protein